MRLLCKKYINFFIYSCFIIKRVLYDLLVGAVLILHKTELNSSSVEKKKYISEFTAKDCMRNYYNFEELPLTDLGQLFP